MSRIEEVDSVTPLDPSAPETCQPVTLSQRLRVHLRIARFDHSIKQVFILPGIVVAISIAGTRWSSALAGHIVLGLVASTLVACSNYVLNEILDAPFDRRHPTKKNRPAACGLVHLGWGYAQWIAMMFAGLGLGLLISRQFVLSAAALWIMGCIYNISPIRSKDLPYVDVLSESINNPIRFCLGWYVVTSSILPPVSLLLSYWMLGAYFMALKRFSEYRQIGDATVAASYRRSFRYYNEESLLNSVVFYSAAAMLFFGAFAMRYRMELILSFPFIAWLMAVYFGLSFQAESAVQNPEKLYRVPRLMIPLGFCILTLFFLLYVNIPWLEAWFPRSAP
jgi:4-hydroxybenzoate polyprenyltransferase